MEKNSLIELIKWLISSVVIVIVTLIIDTGFKEREMSIKEIEVYDKYVDIILRADNIEQRWKLCEYFSIVTPTERLRTRWQSYKDSIQDDYLLWKRNQLDTTEVELNNSSLITSSDSKLSKLNEEFGFEFLLKKDVEESINSFQKAEELQNGYHNCYEISRYLKMNKSELLNKNSEVWNELYVKILNEWSWGLSSNYKQKLSQVIKSN